MTAKGPIMLVHRPGRVMNVFVDKQEVALSKSERVKVHVVMIRVWERALIQESTPVPRGHLLGLPYWACVPHIDSASF